MFYPSCLPFFCTMACFERCQLLRSIVLGRGRERGIWEEGTVERKGQDGWRGDDYGIDESPTTTTTITTNGPAFPCCIRFHSSSTSSLSSPWRRRHLTIKPTCFPAVLTSHNDPPREAASSRFVHHIYIFPTFPAFRGCARTLASTPREVKAKSYFLLSIGIPV